MLQQSCTAIAACTYCILSHMKPVLYADCKQQYDGYCELLDYVVSSNVSVSQMSTEAARNSLQRARMN